MDTSWNVRERYLQLPGGVLFTIRNTTLTSTTNVYTLPNVHGDAMATTNGAGTLVGTFTYDPFGKSLSVTTPDNANGKGDFDYLGQDEKQTETLFTNQPQLMGARIYMSVLGRFVSTDPIDGGNANSYAYPQDPVNENDVSGELAMRPVPDIGSGAEDAKIANAVCGGWWMVACLFDAWEFRGAEAAVKGGVYIVPRTSAGKIYIGQTNNFLRRAAEHAKSGKIPFEAPRLQIPIQSQKGRDFAERNILNLLGGKDAPWIENKINGPNRR